MLETRFDRYDSEYCSEQFEKSEIKIINNQAIVAFDLDEQEFEVYMLVTSNEANSQAMEVAKDLMRNISELDNLVQNSNANECERTGLDPANYDLYLAYITIKDDQANFTYYGERVNTEWDAIFKKEGTAWKKVNF